MDRLAALSFCIRLVFQPRGCALANPLLFSIQAGSSHCLAGFCSACVQRQSAVRIGARDETGSGECQA